MKISAAYLRLSKLYWQWVARNLSLIRLITAVIGLVVAVTVVLTLWLYDPAFALLCIPMVASVLIALALMFALPVKNRRQSLR
jgi:hypothetical protein